MLFDILHRVIVLFTWSTPKRRVKETTDIAGKVRTPREDVVPKHNVSRVRQLSGLQIFRPGPFRDTNAYRRIVAQLLQALWRGSIYAFNRYRLADRRVGLIFENEAYGCAIFIKVWLERQGFGV